MARKRRSFSPAFTAKVALEAIRGVKTIAEIAQKTKLRATQINLWKKQLLDGAEDVFLDGKAQPSKKTSVEPESAELYEQIGRLKVQLEWLKKSGPRRQGRRTLSRWYSKHLREEIWIPASHSAHHRDALLNVNLLEQADCEAF